MSNFSNSPLSGLPAYLLEKKFSYSLNIPVVKCKEFTMHIVNNIFPEKLDISSLCVVYGRRMSFSWNESVENINITFTCFDF